MTDSEIQKIRDKIKFLRNKNNPYGVEGQVLDWVNRCDLLLDDLVAHRSELRQLRGERVKCSSQLGEMRRELEADLASATTTGTLIPGSR